MKKNTKRANAKTPIIITAAEERIERAKEQYGEARK